MDININKRKNTKEGTIDIRYRGIADNVDLNKINALLEDFINNHSHDNMTDNIANLRTIFRDSQEQFLLVICKDDTKIEFVKYENLDLILYEKTRKDNNKTRYKIKYEEGNGVKLDYNSRDAHINNRNDFDFMSKEIYDVLNEMYKLQGIKPLSIRTDELAMIEIYRLFYNENPDFSKDDINIKIQAMLSILAEFGIVLSVDYGFSLLEKTEMPLTLTLEYMINRLYFLGEVCNIDESIKLASDKEKIIKIVGEYVRKAINNAPDQNEALISISKVFYAGRYRLSPNSDIKELSEFTNQTPNEVEATIKLVREINSKIEK